MVVLRGSLGDSPIILFWLLKFLFVNQKDDSVLKNLKFLNFSSSFVHRVHLPVFRMLAEFLQ